MDTETSSLVGKKVTIKWRRWKKKPELACYPAFRVESVLDLGGGWVQLQPFLSANHFDLNEPPVWVSAGDIDWMAEIKVTSR